MAHDGSRRLALLGGFIALAWALGCGAGSSNQFPEDHSVDASVDHDVDGTAAAVDTARAVEAAQEDVTVGGYLDAPALLGTPDSGDASSAPGVDAAMPLPTADAGSSGPRSWPPWPAATPDSGWTANWIWGAAASSPPNTWMAFRKTFPLSAAPTTARADIAADSKYWLWVNGRLAVFEGGLKRGPAPGDTYYDEVDIAPFLQAGQNTIAILVWYWGKDGFSHKSSGQSGLLFQADLAGVRVVSDATWRARQHTAYSPQTGIAPNFRLSEWNVDFDARSDLTGWTNPAYDDSAWSTAAARGKPPVAPWNHLWPRIIPQWKDSGIRSYANAPQLPTIATGAVIHAALPYNAQVTPYLHVKGAGGSTIQIQTDHQNDGGEPNVSARYVMRDGDQEYESFGWMSGEEVQYTVPAGVEIVGLGYRETGYAAGLSGAFTCSDASLNSLWSKAQRTLYINMRDNYSDCPTRERALWWGDVVTDIGETFYALDRSSDFLTRKAISSLLEWQRPDNTFYSPVPGAWNSELPQQMLASIGRSGIWAYYQHSGDLAAIQAAYARVRAYLALFQTQPSGLVVHRAGQWDWSDWGTGIDVPLLDNAWYYMAMDAAARMAEATGHGGDVSGYQSLMAKLKTAFVRQFWNGAAFVSPGQPTPDDRGNGLAVVAGLTDPSQWTAIRTLLATTQHASPYMEKYVLESLFLMNDAQGALDRMRARYRPMILSPHTTLWEQWTAGGSLVSNLTSTTDHAWAGGPLTLMTQYVAGISPTSPGYSRFQVMPQLGPLTQASAVVPSAAGSISVDISLTQNQVALAVGCPPGSEATVGIPLTALGVASAANRVDVTVNGTPVFRAGTFLSGSMGPKFGGEAGGYLTFIVGPGTWNFVARVN